MRARRALAGLGLAGALAAGALGFRAWGLGRAEATLRGQGLSWERRVDRWDGSRWEDLRGTGVVVQVASVYWFPRPQVSVGTAAVDLEARLEGADPGSVGQGRGLPAWVAVEVTDLSITWGDLALAGPLSGTLSPVLELRGPGTELRREDGEWVAHVQRRIDAPQLAGTADLELRVGAARSWALDMPDAVLAHPMLADRALPPQHLHVEGSWAADGAVELRARIGEIPAHGVGKLSTRPRAGELQITVGPAPLDAVVAVFGDLIPEARRAELSGELGGTLTLSAPPLSWKVEPRADGLAASGVIQNAESLASGPFSYQVTDSKGERRVRESGEGSTNWVAEARATRMGSAVIAAEDAAFWTHHGYDLEAISEAALAWAAGEQRPRGGSTLTQQLAKNLFLDGDRTLVRKLRELLYALDLERSLGKHRILELYVNVVQFGPDLWGVGPAADRYFLKQPEGLTWREAAFLASVLPAPELFYQRALLRDRPSVARVDRVIENLRRLGTISSEEAAAARRADLRFVPVE